MIVQIIEILLILIFSFYGVKSTFQRKDVFMLFFWLINMYQSVMASINCLGIIKEGGSDLFEVVIGDINNPTTIFIHIIFICNASFIAAEFYLRKKTVFNYDFDRNTFLSIDANEKLFNVLFFVFIISGTIYFLTYMDADYSTFNKVAYSSNKLVARLMQVSSCVMFYLAYKKKWTPFLYFCILFLVLSMRTSVRSLLYVVMLPALTYYLIQYWMNGLEFKQFARFTIPLFIVAIFFGIWMSFDKMGGQVMLPDAELTPLALNALNTYNFEIDGYRTFDTFINFSYGLLGPFMGILGIFGLDFKNPVSFSYVSAALMKGEADLGATVGEWHCPSTIYLDFYISWGWFFPIFCVLVYYFFVYILQFVNKRPIMVVLLSYQMMLFIYFYIRGAVDTASGTLSYPLIYLTFVYVVFSNKTRPAV